ncbi:MAG: anhydro-N-acetylmuramic acid kinase [Gammaproteobacteria bacterium]|nr:anhydro-N-acetylmuramic acid kinase [Gammaproteobacteria bacterium]
MNDDQLYIGIMSGTSLDGVDVVLVDFSDTTPKLLSSLLLPYPAALRIELAAISQPGANEIERMGLIEADLADCYADAVAKLLLQSGVAASQIQAIGCHGQTIRHRPNARQPFSYQIGDMHRLAALTGIRVIGDFRRKDIAFGGQGAPLVPAFHQAIFASPDQGRCILNIGGIANITLLLPHQSVLGFDTGPGNCLLDNWIELHQQQPYDAAGAFAASGQLLPDLLLQLLSDPFFAQTGPKSTGREYFQLQWLNQHLAGRQDAAADVQRTLSRFCAGTMALAISPYPVADIFVCGGGAFNPVLLADLQALLPQCSIQTTAELGVAPDWVEAMAFAWLAYAYDMRIPGNVPAVTGARQPVVLGLEYLAC